MAANRCYGRIQRDCICIRSDRIREDFHDDGTLSSCSRSEQEHEAERQTQGADIDNDNLRGIIPRITEQIFSSIVESDPHLEYLVMVSYMEIYLERIRDLLAREHIAHFFVVSSFL